jgi:hypothetical protein
MNNKLLIGLGVVALLVVGGALGYVAHTAKAPAQQVAGGSFNANQYSPQYFYNGLYYTTIVGKMANSSSTPTTTLTTLQPGVTAPSVGHLTIGTGQTIESASTTAVTASSDRVVVQLEQTTPIAGVTCNTTLNASSSEATTVFASTTNTSLNGFTIQVSGAPVTNPFCYSYSIQHGY